MIVRLVRGTLIHLNQGFHAIIKRRDGILWLLDGYAKFVSVTNNREKIHETRIEILRAIIHNQSK